VIVSVRGWRTRRARDAVRAAGACRAHSVTCAARASSSYRNYFTFCRARIFRCEKSGSKLFWNL